LQQPFFRFPPVCRQTLNRRVALASFNYSQLMSEGSDKENKRVAERTLHQIPKRSKSFTSSLARLNVQEESEEEISIESTHNDKDLVFRTLI